MAAAVLPISKAGCVMVLSDGFSKAAVLKFEKHIIFICSGILIFKSLQTV